MDWNTMNAAERHRPTDLSRSDVPAKPGVYAWYRRGRPVYVGKADDLCDRVWGRHLGQSRTVRTSAFRRNVAERLGFGTPNEIKNGVVVLTSDQVAEMRAWIMGCRVAWIVLPSIASAKKAESDLKAEWKPPLTKI